MNCVDWWIWDSQGTPYTWTNGRQGVDNIQSRLDKGLGSQLLINRFSPIIVNHLPRFGSDHVALLIELDAAPQGVRRKKARIFIFEDCCVIPINFLIF